MKTDILFPVLNEKLRLENGIRRTVEYIRTNPQMADYPCHLVILDNGSTDETPDIGNRLSEEFSEVEYVRIEEKGVGIAFRTGVERSSADIIGTMDIDLSTDISYLGETLKILSENSDIDYVNASRFSPDSDVSGRKWYRKITSAGLVFLLKLNFGMRSSDAICGFTFLRREKALRLVEECYPDNGWFFMIEFLLRAERDGMNICELPVIWEEDYNTTVNIPKTIKNYLINIYRLRKDFYREGKKNAQKS